MTDPAKTLFDQRWLFLDVEADGPRPGDHSMRSIALVEFDPLHRREVGHLYLKLPPLDGAATDPATMEWWRTQPEAWEEVNRGVTNLERAMPLLQQFVHPIDDDRYNVVVGDPAAFDGAFLNYYGHRFLEWRAPKTVMDVRSFLAGSWGAPQRKTRRSKRPKAWYAHDEQHTHCALDDARDLAQFFTHAIHHASAYGVRPGHGDTATRAEVMRAALHDVALIVRESDGVDGYHENGDSAPWNQMISPGSPLAQALGWKHISKRPGGEI